MAKNKKKDRQRRGGGCLLGSGLYLVQIALIGAVLFGIVVSVPPAIVGYANQMTGGTIEDVDMFSDNEFFSNNEVNILSKNKIRLWSHDIQQRITGGGNGNLTIGHGNRNTQGSGGSAAIGDAGGLLWWIVIGGVVFLWFKSKQAVDYSQPDYDENGNPYKE